MLKILFFGIIKHSKREENEKYIKLAQKK